MKNSLSAKFELDSKKKYLIIFSILISSALLIRIVLTSYNIPIYLDAVDYYSFSYRVVTEWDFPKNVLQTNDGWSWLLSFFFIFFKETDFLTLSILQKTLSSIISTMTIIPVFYLCRNFVSGKFAIIGASFFIFDPRIILNSTLGITEPLFIFLSSSILAIIFLNKSKIHYITFLLIGLLSIVRYEGLLMLIPISIIYFIRMRKMNNAVLKFFIGIIIFLLVVAPIGIMRDDVNGINGLSSHLFTGIGDYFSSSMLDNKFENSGDNEKLENSFISSFIFNTISNTLKYLGWIFVPLFIFFVPIGLYKIIRTKDKEISILLLPFAFMIIPAMYAFGREFQDPRYLFVLIPIFSVIVAYGFGKNSDLFEKYWIIILIMIIFILLIFVVYLYDGDTDKTEKYLLAKFVVNTAKGVNSYDGQSFMKTAELEKNWPEPLQSEPVIGIVTSTQKIPFGNAENISQYISISKDKGLSHLVVYEINDKKFLDRIFSNPELYPYLNMKFNSDDKNFVNKVKVFEINYNKFND